jgi:hypothetical protein
MVDWVRSNMVGSPSSAEDLRRNALGMRTRSQAAQANG